MVDFYYCQTVGFKFTTRNHVEYMVTRMSVVCEINCDRKGIIDSDDKFRFVIRRKLWCHVFARNNRNIGFACVIP